MWPLARLSRHRQIIDARSLCDEELEPDEPLYKVSDQCVIVSCWLWTDTEMTT